MMVFVKGLKQLFRTPLTLTLFIVLFTVAAFFVCSGVVIWARNQAATTAYEEMFITIGTVRQRPDSIEIVRQWDAFTEEYLMWSEPVYSGIVPQSVLDFEGSDYILNPEKRPFYAAFRPDLIQWPKDTNLRFMTPYIVEVTPLESFLPDCPAEVLIQRVLRVGTRNLAEFDEQLKAGDVIFLCDHNNDMPEILEAGKSYIMCIREYYPHNLQFDGNEPNEWRPETVVFSSQYTPDGTLVNGVVVSGYISEVTDGFYETEEGRRWLKYIDTMSNYSKTFPVLPTNGTNLLLPFYYGNAYIVGGADITPEEYENGAKVCLVSESFADLNGFLLGDTILLPLLYADYRHAANDRFRELDHSSYGFAWWVVSPFLNADGDPYSVFSEHEYTIKGIYSNRRGSDANHAIGANTVIVPMASIHESDENNILDYGPMLDTTTTFQIPNGSIESYMANWLSQSNDDLEITFHDRGYTKLYHGLQNMKRISVIFLVIGAVMSLALIFFFCNLLITKNIMRTAIERLLGYTKAQCTVSLLTGFLLSAVFSVAVGCTAGVLAERLITDSIETQVYFDTSFTIGPLGQTVATFEAPEISAVYAPAAGLLLLIVTAIVSFVFMLDNLRKEPLKLLSMLER